MIPCGSSDCSTVATVAVHWPGQPCFMCDACAERARGVAAVMGFALSTEPVEVVLERVQQIINAKDAAKRLGAT